MDNYRLVIQGNKYFEKEVIKEIEYILERNVKYNIDKENSLIFLYDLSFEDIISISYLSKTANRVLWLIDEVNNINDLENGLSRISNIVHGKKIAVRVDKLFKYKYSISSVELSALIGEKTLSVCNTCSVDLRDPDIIIRYLITKERDYITVDLVGEKPLYKRCYRVKKDAYVLRPTIFSSLFIRDSIYEKENIVIANSGFCTGCIEAALLLSNKSPNACRKKELLFTRIFNKNWIRLFDRLDKQNKTKLKNNIYCVEQYFNSINIGKLMAKRALVEDYIIFRRIDLEWLDLKFKESSIDYFFMYVGRKLLNKEFINSLFYALEYICSNSCVIRIVTDTKHVFENISRKIIEKYGFIIEESMKLFGHSSNYRTIKIVQK